MFFAIAARSAPSIRAALAAISRRITRRRRDARPSPGRVLLSGKVERIPDCLADPEYVVPMGSSATNVRSLLGVPLLGKDGVEGALILTRAEPGDFTDRQIEIVQTFADQAVIAHRKRAPVRRGAGAHAGNSPPRSMTCARRRIASSSRKSSLRSASSPPASPTRSRTRSISSTISRRCRASWSANWPT